MIDRPAGLAGSDAFFEYLQALRETASYDPSTFSDQEVMTANRLTHEFTTSRITHQPIHQPFQ